MISAVLKLVGDAGARQMCCTTTDRAVRQGTNLAPSSPTTNHQQRAHDQARTKCQTRAPGCRDLTRGSPVRRDRSHRPSRTFGARPHDLRWRPGRGCDARTRPRSVPGRATRARSGATGVARFVTSSILPGPMTRILFSPHPVPHERARPCRRSVRRLSGR